MSLLANLATDSSIQDEVDTLGGGSRTLESGAYHHTITMAYVNKSKGGALGLVLTLKDDTGKEFNNTLWMTGGTSKGCKNYWEKDGKKHYLPGFVNANALCLLTVGKEVSQMDTEEKVVGVYNYEAKAEVPTKVDVLMDLLGKEIITGVFKNIEDKNTLNTSTGRYEPTGETREVNEIDKFFRAEDGMTTAEVRAQVAEASFINSWKEKWTGVTRDRSKGVAKGATAGAPKAAQATKPTTSLFATA